METKIDNILKDCLTKKFATYTPETNHMPFHTHLLGKDRMALYSFIQSLNTTFGTSIFEPVAKELGSHKFQSSLSQQTAGLQISSDAALVIQDIIESLSSAEAEPCKQNEIEAIRKVCRSGEMRKVNLTKVDLKLVSHTGAVYLIDIKTAKPNAGGFREFKRTLLEWTAAVLADNPNTDIHTMIAIPYNPYEPKPYKRWTIRGMIDLQHELLIAKDFWDFVGGKGSYEMLLDVFEKVGIEMRPAIDQHFARFLDIDQ